jgi:hypothetical protein
MKLLTLNEIPENHKELFFQDFETALNHNKSAVQAKSEMKESFCYLISIFWQSRYSKMSTEHVAFFDWISVNMLPKHLEYKGVIRQSTLINSSTEETPLPSHYEIAETVFEALWIAYENTEGNSFKTKKTFFSKIKKLFS